MKRMIVFVTSLILVITCSASAAVLYEENFDALDDWTVQQTDGITYCNNDSCGVGGIWTGYYNGACKCSESVNGWPGNNLVYIDQYAGYPEETNTCRGSSGKCATFWLESCTEADDSDGQLTKLFDQEYEEVYLRFYIKFKSGWELKTPVGSNVTKFFHIQHYLDGSPHAYHTSNPGNQPVTVGLLTEYGDNVQFYTENRCQVDYYCNTPVVWNLSTITAAYQTGGIYDGDWHSIEVRVKRNSEIGVADGINELWFDGTKIDYVNGYEGNALEMNDSGSSELRGFRWFNIGGNTNNQFDASCSSLSDCEQWYSIDDVVVSTTYIGTDDPPTTTPTIQGATALGVIINQ